VSGDNGISASFNVSFTVTQKDVNMAIIFTPEDTWPVERGGYVLTAGTSGDAADRPPVQFKLAPTENATLRGDTLFPLQSGTVTVIAYVDSNANYLPAAEVPREIRLTSSSAGASIEVTGASSEDGRAYVVDDPSTETITITILPNDGGAKIIYNGQEVTSPITVDVSCGGTQEVSYTVVSQDGSREQLYTLTVEQQLDFNTYVTLKGRNMLVFNKILLEERGYTVTNVRWYGNGKLLAENFYYALSEQWMAFSPDVVYHFELETSDGRMIRSTGRNFDFSTAVAGTEGIRQLTLYPNPLPSGATLTVYAGEWGVRARELLIYNAAGSLVLRQRFSGAFVTLPFAAPAGVYFLRVDGQYGKMVVR
jgi:hypothetical protein